MIKIITENTVHRNEKRVKLIFDYTQELIKKIRQIHDCRWSKTMKCWHIPYREDYMNFLNKQFDGQIKFIEKQEIKKQVSKTRKNIPDKIELKQEVKDSINEFYKYLKRQRYADNTIKTYISMMNRFFEFIKKEPDKICNDDIKLYNDDFILKNNFSATYQNQFINALKKYYEKIENKNLQVEELERPRKARRLPKVISKENVKKLLDSVKNIKHKTILSLIYSAGLRRSEVLNLKINDIDSNRMIITIRDAKGKKDRIVGLSKNILSLLKIYYKMYKPKEYLFEGQNRSKYSGASIGKIFNNAKNNANINIEGGVHILRHCYATHLHEAGYDIRLIQELLGHKSSKTTEIYTHVSTKSIKNVKSPFDDLE